LISKGEWFVKKLIGMSVLALASCVAFAGDDTPAPPPLPKSPVALAVMHKYDEAAKDAKKVYYRALIAAGQQEVIGLQRAQAAAQRADDLEDERAIKLAIKSAEATLQQNRDILDDKAPASKWVAWHMSFPGGTNVFWLFPDHTCISANHYNGTWERTGNTVSFSWQGNHDVFTVDDSGNPISGRHTEDGATITITSVGSDLTGDKPPPDPSQN
jgi:hypothetical protein